MKVYSKYIIASIAGIIILLVTFTACSTTHLPIPNNDSILTWMKNENVPTVGICIIEDGTIRQTIMIGSIEYHSPAPLNTLFNIASLTKPLLSMTTLKLVSNGQWNLDEPLYHYWTDPDVANDSLNRKLTTRHVLSHQSGLPNWRGHEPGGKLSFAFEPGTQWKYSGEGFEYLRKALENKFNIPIERLVDSILFKPLGMNDTRFYWDDTMDTTLYADRYDAEGKPYEKERWYSANASNLVLTTVEDYAKFAIAILKGNYLSPEVQKEMIQKQALTSNGIEVGLGWFMIKNLSNGGYLLYHSGSNRGQNTKVFLLPESRKGIIIFTNGENGNNVCEKIISEYFDSGKEILDRIK
ncbi:MAG TPA: serine hydrolase domain-containing protein [Bacteroidales bacterium]|nr:serine hydrolase domain-containing protein [Bacteroidales bacterium]